MPWRVQALWPRPTLGRLFVGFCAFFVAENLVVESCPGCNAKYCGMPTSGVSRERAVGSLRYVPSRNAKEHDDGSDHAEPCRYAPRRRVDSFGDQRPRHDNRPGENKSQSADDDEAGNRTWLGGKARPVYPSLDEWGSVTSILARQADVARNPKPLGWRHRGKYVLLSLRHADQDLL
jgi:hypothetical protein